jgi:hypothetical protein
LIVVIPQSNRIIHFRQHNGLYILLHYNLIVD